MGGCNRNPPRLSAVLVAATRVRVVVEVCALALVGVESLARIGVEDLVFGIH